MMERARRRSPQAQILAMRKDWPGFAHHKFGDGTMVWGGVLRPQAQQYYVEVLWNPKLLDRPFVFIREPEIAPRAGKRFEDIPHLMFNQEQPSRSALCLFDPDGAEWTPADLIAKTTIDWTSEWLTYYELWHLTGEWLAPGVGYESVGEMKEHEAENFRAIAGHTMPQDRKESAA